MAVSLSIPQMPKALLSVALPAPTNLTVMQYGVYGDTEEYEGSYVFTPTQSTQTIPIADKKATQDIIINPIPSNYGLITWNGAILTVS